MERTGLVPPQGADGLALVSGALAGVAGLLVFLALHALWILPIWFILPAGLVFALLGGVAMGWAYAQLRPALPQRPPAALVMLVVVIVSLLPAILLAELRPTLFIETPGGALPTEPIPMLIVRFVAKLLVTSTIVGGLIGWWLRRTRRAVVATALASFLFALGPGHNIPFLGGTSGVQTELVLLAAVIVVSTLVLVESHRLLTALRRRSVDRGIALSAMQPSRPTRSIREFRVSFAVLRGEYHLRAFRGGSVRRQMRMRGTPALRRTSHVEAWCISCRGPLCSVSSSPNLTGDRDDGLRPSGSCSSCSSAPLGIGPSSSTSERPRRAG